ncbi:substrate-binding protein-like domain-containing protein [Pustulibacterium marinum]|uniref:Substrate-binding protein-like domain-containing protein n=1 Tax=Pustulibacterium marinum TaxID=1224947 RepID=A0A1I7H674_9FLAO|nr:substrate-binding domain-containing protein [Pustulibacterium marinum]SFU56200.1 substrate-binding protein-like domain-containing protein [Pustulibacterium marinum]
MKLINIEENSSVPKYKQIIFSVETAIAEKRLKKRDKLPSINKVALEFSLSRDTVLQAYDDLKKRGIIIAMPGKGYYIKSEEFTTEQRIFLLFDELNSFKEDLYHSFKETMGTFARIDIFFHYFSIDVFKKLINENNGDYSKYVIMPTILKDAPKYIKKLPKNDVYILDQTNDELKEYPSIHQNFVSDIYSALLTGKEALDKYEKLVMIFPDFKQPPGMRIGFNKFCNDYQLQHEIIPDIKDYTLEKGQVFIIPDDRHLVNVIEEANSKNLVIGTDIGIISYNDTHLKKVVANGITTISTDFTAMGTILAEMVLGQRKEQIANKSRLILRGSL